MTFRHRVTYRLLHASIMPVLGLLALQCADIVGIEDAQLDPKLAAGGSGDAGNGGDAGDAGQGGQGGSAANAGQPEAGRTGGGGVSGSPMGGQPDGGDEGQAGRGGVLSGAGEAGATAAGGRVEMAGEAGVGGEPAEAGQGGAAGAPEAAGAGGMPEEETQEELCARYCDSVIAHCIDEYAVYTSPETCTAVCLTLEPGTEGDSSGNTVHCRLSQANFAAETGEPDVHCPLAGPGGDGTCGENCEGFCTIMEQACPTEFAQTYESEPVLCQTACSVNWDDLEGYDASISTGPTVQCLLWHISAAARAGGVHCTEHSIGIGPCDPAG